MFVIQDVASGRFLSDWSIVEDFDGSRILFSTYSGKLSTAFFKYRIEAEKLLVELKKRIGQYNLKIDIKIETVDVDKLPSGQTFRKYIII